MDKLDKMANMIRHLEGIRDKLYRADRPEISLSPLERALIWDVIGFKIYSIAEEAEPLIPRNRRGRPNTGKTESTIHKELEIAQEYYNMYEPDKKNSDSVIEFLRKKHRYKNRSSILKAIYSNNERIENIKIEQRPVMTELERAERRKMNDIFFEGREKLDEIKY